MIQIIQNPVNQLEHYVYGTRFSKIYFRGSAADCLVYIQRQRARINRNKTRRDRNAVLRDLTGTSAACARRDMGLNSGGY